MKSFNLIRIPKKNSGADGFGFDFYKVDECTMYLLIIISYFIEHVSWTAQNTMVC